MAGTPEERGGSKKERQRIQRMEDGAGGRPIILIFLIRALEEGRKEVVSGRLDKGTWHEDQAWGF